MNKTNENTSSNDEPFWVTHPEYYPDGPDTHLKKKRQNELQKKKKNINASCVKNKNTPEK